MSHMKLKNNKKKKKKFKYLFLIIFIYFIFSYTFYNSFKNNKNISNEKFINFLLNNGNSNFTNEYKFPTIINNTMSYLLKIDFTNPETLFNESILGYNNELEETNEYSNLDKLKEVSYYMSDPNKVDIDNPVVYIYNSHQLENYDNSNLEIYGITPNVLMASYLLKEKLNEKGISTVVEDTNLTEFLELNNWDYSGSYKASRIFMLDKQNTYKSLKYYIDIHRDSVNKKLSTVTIGDKSYARILFVVGLEHKNYQKNLDLANKINSLFEKHYKGLSRGVLKKEGKNVNGIYNQDISENAMLIEVGGVDNNIDEVLNTINAISDILSIYIGDSK
ncbi:MAG: stage II sporulation protein P [Bacilli bacterium]|nr:stage II sporulation protein P [Bacilli bacterium]